MSAALFADRLNDKSMVIEMGSVFFPDTSPNHPSRDSLVFHGSHIGNRVFSGPYTENADGQVSHLTWYADIPSVEDQVAISEAMDQRQVFQAKFNAELTRNAMNNMLCIQSKLNDSTRSCSGF